ncbi:hypothetical protein PanWU01x14_223810, partial [Parasponia andersonii]
VNIEPQVDAEELQPQEGDLIVQQEPVVPDQQVVHQEPLYERLRKMCPVEFEGSTDPLVAEE